MIEALPPYIAPPTQPPPRTERTAARRPRVALFSAGDALFVVSSEPLDGALTARLSASERAVAALVVEGLDNASIARARGRSLRTIANQVAAVLRKVGVGSRVELAALFSREDCGQGWCAPSAAEGA